MRGRRSTGGTCAYPRAYQTVFAIVWIPSCLQSIYRTRGLPCMPAVFCGVRKNVYAAYKRHSKLFGGGLGVEYGSAPGHVLCVLVSMFSVGSGLAYRMVVVSFVCVVVNAWLLHLLQPDLERTRICTFISFGRSVKWVRSCSLSACPQRGRLSSSRGRPQLYLHIHLRRAEQPQQRGASHQQHAGVSRAGEIQ